MSHRIHNFAAGPAALPTPVLEKMQSELLDFNGTGVSIMEMSHRGAVYTEVFLRTREAFRRLLNIPDNYQILFMQGGAIGENAIIPLNLLGNGNATVNSVVSGAWSVKTQKEADRYAQERGGECRIIANSDDGNGKYLYFQSQTRGNCPTRRTTSTSAPTKPSTAWNGSRRSRSPMT